MKKVSVIMSSYNHEKYIESTIESVLNQSYKDFVFIIADDGSTDSTQEILKNYEAKINEIHLFDHSILCRDDVLVDLVQTEYTAIINSDDLWDKEKLNKQVMFLDTNPQFAACFSWAKQIDDDGAVKEIANFRQPNRSRAEWFRYFYSSGNCLATPSVLIRTDIYKEIRNQVFHAFRQLPDFHNWIRLLQKYNFHIIPEELVTFRWHTNGTNVSAPSTKNSIRQINEEIHLWYKEIPRMENNFFKETFSDIFINVNASSEADLICEKFFVLYRAREAILRQAAIQYFYDIYTLREVRDTFINTYHYSRKDFSEAIFQLGFASMINTD